jgi:hypothetical protein
MSTMTMKHMKVNPSDLSSLLFSTNEISVEPYVSSAVRISTEGVAQGRGLVATRDIQQGKAMLANPLYTS